MQFIELLDHVYIIIFVLVHIIRVYSTFKVTKNNNVVT